MQRTVLIALVTAVVAAAVATGATIVLTGDDELAVASPTPLASVSPTPATTTEVVTASPSPGTSPSPDAPVAATDTPASTPSGTSVATRSAKSVDCGREPKFCSATDSVKVGEDMRTSAFTQGNTPQHADAPRVTLNSELRESNKTPVEPEDALASIHVEVLVENKSDRTFVFAKREIVLDIYRNGKLFDSFATDGDGFEMTPNSKMTGTFDRPITAEGDYSWRAKVWYYAK